VLQLVIVGAFAGIQNPLSQLIAHDAPDTRVASQVPNVPFSGGETVQLCALAV
jgi:hypothetical protein